MKAAIQILAGIGAASACFDNDWLIEVSGSSTEGVTCPGSTNGEVCAPDGSSNYHNWAGTYDDSTGKFSGSMTTNLCANDHWGLYTNDSFMPFANHTARCTEQTFPAPDYASDGPKGAPLRGRVGMTLSGVNIYGPEEAGFGVGSNPKPCHDGSGKCWAGVDVPTCETSLDLTCNGTDNVNHGLMLDTCGGHALPYHYHNDMACDYDHTVAAHSPLIGLSLDGYGVYGLYESFADGKQAKPSDLDACNGHTHEVPANATFGVKGGSVYHYHTTSWAPYTIGCYGPVDSQATCKTLYQSGGGGGPAAHGQCDKEILPVYTPETPEGYCYDTDCPCFDGDHDRFSKNTDMKIEECACYDRCDTTSSGCKHTCDVLVHQMNYSCANLYAPGMKYAGWCDKTCGYAKCAK